MTDHWGIEIERHNALFWLPILALAFVVMYVALMFI